MDWASRGRGRGEGGVVSEFLTKNPFIHFFLLRGGGRIFL